MRLFRGLPLLVAALVLSVNAFAEHGLDNSNSSLQASYNQASCVRRGCIRNVSGRAIAASGGLRWHTYLGYKLQREHSH